MKSNFALLLFCSILSINSAIFVSEQADSMEHSLKQVLLFINKSENQTSPIFDLSTKPSFELINSALDRVIQKAISQKNFSSNSTDDEELAALQQKNIVEQLYLKNSSLFLSPEDLKNEKKLVKVEASEKTDGSVSSGFNKPSFDEQSFDDQVEEIYTQEPNASPYASPHDESPLSDNDSYSTHDGSSFDALPEDQDSYEDFSPDETIEDELYWG